MGKITAINAQGITPAVILQTLGEELPEIESLYCVAIDKNGTPKLYASGDLSHLAIASLSLQQLAFDYLNGRIEAE